MRTQSNYVVLTEEPNWMRAHWIAGGLEAADIPTFVDQDNLVDEFAMSQKLMGLQRVRVLVPRDLLGEARAVFLAMSQPIPLMDPDEEDTNAERQAASGPRSHFPWAFRARLLLILLLLGLGCALALVCCLPSE